MIRLVHDLPEEQYIWRNDPSVYLTCRQQGPIRILDHMKWLESLPMRSDVEMFGIEVTPESGIPGFKKKPFLVGTAGLTGISEKHGTAEWSLLIGPPHQGRGYATLALLELLRHGFEVRRLNLIWGEIMDINVKSLSLAKSVGFKTEAKLRSRYWKVGSYVDSYIVSMTLDEWNRKKVVLDGRGSSDSERGCTVTEGSGGNDTEVGSAG